MTGKELIRWTGYADDNITNGVHLLTDLGWLVAIGPRGPWGLAGKARQLPLVNFFEQAESDLIGIGNATTTTNRIDPPFILNQVVEVEGSPKKSESRRKLKPRPEPKNPHFSENLKACRSSGIGEPMASRLSDLFDEYEQPITPDFILAHVKDTGRENIGLAITRIQGFELPSDWLEEIGSIPKPSAQGIDEED